MLCSGGPAGYVVAVAQALCWVGENENTANSAQLELELGLSLAKITEWKLLQVL